MAYIIQSESLTKFYKNTRALNQVNLQVEQGEIFGFLGPNGAGKTTFVKTMLNFIRPSSGQVRVLGELPNRLNRESIGYLPERISIHPFLTGREFLKYQARLTRLKPADIAQAVETCLKRVHMQEDADRQIEGYSKGMMQRIGLAQALLGEPELLILDEPNSGLDPIGVLQIREAILEEKKRGATIFLNSHQLLEVEKTCDRVAILNKGELVAQGSSEELGGEQGIELEVEELNENLMKYLRGLDPHLRIIERKIEMSIPDQETERLLPAKIVEKGARILYYAKKRESLEEVFKRLVKN